MTFNPKSMPWASVAVLAILVAAILILSIVNGASHADLIVTLIALIPSVLASGFAERNSKDLRNGVIQDKARLGAVDALQEAAPAIVKDCTTKAIQEAQQGPVTIAALTALQKILEINTDATEANTAVHQHEAKE